MSTHTRRPTEPNPTTDESNPTASEPHPTAAEPNSTAETRPDSNPRNEVSTASPSDAASDRHADDAESWVARCQAQFDAGRTDRLRNLADAANGAIPGGS